MYPYLICFLITILLAYANEKYLRKHENSNKKSNASKVILAALVILPPAILAGLRDYVVGTDVMVYAYSTFNDAQYIHSISDFFNPAGTVYNSPIEIGFWLLAWFSTLFGNDAHIFLFFISLFIGIFVYLILYRMREFVSLWLGETVYLLCFYNETLNMMRQSMAVVMVMYAFTFVYYNRSWKKFLLIAIPSYFFHHSALIGLSLFIPVLMLGKENIGNKLSKKQMGTTIIISLLFAGVAANFINIANIAINVNDVFSEKYEYYIEDMTAENARNGIRILIFYFIPYLLLYLRRKEIKFGYMFLCIALIDAAFYYLRLRMPFLFRICSYYYWFRILSFSAFSVYQVKGKILNNILYKVLLILILFFYWRLNYGAEDASSQIHGSHETMPYKSEILNIK